MNILQEARLVYFGGICMSALTDLIRQVEDESLRGKLLAEADKLAKQKKFGLVFEEHLPECTRLYDLPVKLHGRFLWRQVRLASYMR